MKTLLMKTNLHSLLYYEAHITIDPVPEEHRYLVEALGVPHKFKLAKLLMEKQGVLSPSTLDTFMTAHGTSLDDMIERVKGMVLSLQKNFYKVKRYKIEDTVSDSRTEDVYKILAKYPT